MAEAKDTKSKTQSPAHGTRHAKPQAHESSGPAPGVDGGATSLVASPSPPTRAGEPRWCSSYNETMGTPTYSGWRAT